MDSSLLQAPPSMGFSRQEYWSGLPFPSTVSQRVGPDQRDPAHINTRLFFLPVATLPQWELSVKVAQLLGLWGSRWCQVCRDMDCLHGRSCGPIRVFFQASCSWWSEGLFGQSFSIAPPIQALRRDPLPKVLLCCSESQALKGAPWVGSYSAVQCIRCLMAQPLYCSAADAGVWRERRWWWLHPLHMTQQYCLASMAAWLSSTGISHHSLILTSPWAVCPQSTAALSLGLLHNP